MDLFANLGLGRHLTPSQYEDRFQIEAGEGVPEAGTESESYFRTELLPGGFALYAYFPQHVHNDREHGTYSSTAVMSFQDPDKEISEAIDHIRDRMGIDQTVQLQFHAYVRRGTEDEGEDASSHSDSGYSNESHCSASQPSSFQSYGEDDTSVSADDDFSSEELSTYDRLVATFRERQIRVIETDIDHVYFGPLAPVTARAISIIQTSNEVTTAVAA